MKAGMLLITADFGAHLNLGQLLLRPWLLVLWNAHIFVLGKWWKRFSYRVFCLPSWNGATPRIEFSTYPSMIGSQIQQVFNKMIHLLHRFLFWNCFTFRISFFIFFLALGWKYLKPNYKLYCQNCLMSYWSKVTFHKPNVYGRYCILIWNLHSLLRDMQMEAKSDVFYVFLLLLTWGPELYFYTLK